MHAVIIIALVVVVVGFIALDARVLFLVVGDARGSGASIAEVLLARVAIAERPGFGFRPHCVRHYGAGAPASPVAARWTSGEREAQIEIRTVRPATEDEIELERLRQEIGPDQAHHH